MSTTFEVASVSASVAPTVLPSQAATEAEAPAERPVVWIVDDDEAITAMISRLVESIGYQPRAYNDCSAFLAEHDPSTIGCLLSDISMPGMSGLDLLRRLRDQNTLLPTIFITGHGSIPMCVEAMQIGAFDFIQKPFSPSQLKELVKRAIDADRQRQAAAQRVNDIQARLATLTPDERETLRLILDGSMNKNIAAALDVSRRTVQYRISSLLEKMGVRSRSQLISLVTAAGMNNQL
jgi:FixJ family two-component response regulator